MKLDNKTQLFRPLQTPVQNITSFYFYCWRNHKPCILVIKTILFVMALVSLVGDVTDFITGTFWSRLLAVVGFVLPAILTFVEFAGSYEERFTSLETDPELYLGVEVKRSVNPSRNDWERIDIETPSGIDPVFRSDNMDLFLRSGEPIALIRDTNYEKDLRRLISDKSRWEGIYYPFLRHNHRNAMFQGKQFYNEKKYGLSRPLYPGDKQAVVHKTCYFDTYLTNIIPGQKLVYNRDMEVAADASEDALLPFTTEENRKVLKEVGTFTASNELGISTILLTGDDHILLWRQNYLSQCSNGLLMASGSGSADWDDCKDFIGDPDGLRKAVIRGMQRELWEESNGDRAISKARFDNGIETRLTGYFRWLKKGAKPEFSGVTRLVDHSLLRALSPELSEVTDGGKEALRPAGTIAELIESIDQLLSLKNCNVSCTMALRALKDTCQTHCRNCPHKDDNSCSAETCQKRPYDVLFD